MRNNVDQYIITLPDGKVVSKVKWSMGYNYDIGITYSDNMQEAIKFVSFDLALEVMDQIGDCEITTI